MIYGRGFDKVSNDDLLDAIYAFAGKGHLDLSEEELIHLGRSQVKHVGWTSRGAVPKNIKRKMDRILKLATEIPVAII